MDTATLPQSVRDTKDSKTAWAGMRDVQNPTAPGAKLERERCDLKLAAACKPHRGCRGKLPVEEIRRLRGQGQTGGAIAKRLRLKTSSVYGVLGRIGLGTGRQRHKRDVLPNGRIRCCVCHEIKDASKFCCRASRCRSCDYGQMAMRSNQDLDQAIHIRNVWFRNRAKRLGIYYDLTDEQLTELYVLQDGRCAYCRKPMVLRLGIRRSGWTASIERIIPDMLGGTYTAKNVVWVHSGCNSRRWALAGERLKVRFPEASKAIEQVALERQLELPFPLDSEIAVTNDPGPFGQNPAMIHVIPSFISTHEGVCDICGLPGHISGLMSVPGVSGHYCSVGCVECHLFGPGRCRWCGFRLDPGPAFCSDQCRWQNETARFGGGKRLAMWLSRHEPRLFADLVGREIPEGLACLQCGDSLDGKRRDSLFCSPNCQHRFKRSSYNPTLGSHLISAATVNGKDTPKHLYYTGEANNKAPRALKVCRKCQEHRARYLGRTHPLSQMLARPG